MKKTLLATVALVSLAASTAFAADLPAKTAPGAPLTAMATSVDSLSFSYGQDFVLDDFGTKSKDTFGATYAHKFAGGYSAGAAISTSQDTSNTVTQNIEVQGGYSTSVLTGLTVGGKIGVGERFTTDNFSYYAVYGAADYKVNDDLTVNAVSYRYRSAFDTDTNGYQSNQIGTGITYNINSTYAITTKIARNFDKDFNQTGDAFTTGLTIKF
jgi:hypothetical protein